MPVVIGRQSVQVAVIRTTSPVTITDPDCSAVVSKAKVVLLERDSKIGESLVLVDHPPLSIDHEITADTSTITIQGQESHEVYIDVLKRVQYKKSDGYPDSDRRIVSYRVYDGVDWSSAEPVFITVRRTPPLTYW